MVPLAPPREEPAELRVAAWGADNLPRSEEGSASYYVRCLLPADADQGEDQQSDIHWHSTDCSAAFNWRFVSSRLTLPSRGAPEAIVQVWRHYLSARHVCVAECRVDLLLPFERVHSDRSPFHCPRTSHDLKSTATGHPLKGAKIDLEYSVLPLKEAEEMPVGLGREEPNRSPFLDVPAHRAYWRGSPVAVGLFALGAALKWWINLAFWVVVVCVAATVFSFLAKFF
eukprot:Polyplicarium_translucidae@DN4745_c0_g1_i1.p1